MNGRDGEVLRYLDADVADEAADFFEKRFGFDIEVKTIEEWLEEFHAPMVVAKRAASDLGNAYRDILQEMYDNCGLLEDYIERVGDLLAGKRTP